VLLETSRVSEGFTKIDLAKRAGLDASSVRRLLTSKTANPTTDNAFRLMAAMGITLEATLPTGKRVSLIKGRRNAAGNGRSAAKKVAVKTATRKKTVVCKQCAANKASSKKAVAKKTVPA
jgi:transcriptional regulator with XRE-family HTH domain